MRGDIQLAGSRWSIGPALFTAPREVLETSLTHEVTDLISTAEERARSGNWVVGYISYQAASGVNPTLEVPGKASLPLAWFGVYQSKDAPRLRGDGTFRLGRWAARMSAADHGARLAAIKEAIHQGLTYQVNLTFPMAAAFEGTPQSLFAAMVRAQPNSYGAILDIGEEKVLSVSPELYLATSGRHIITKPMKGTAPRGRHSLEDLRHSEELRHSEKEQASNVMIVDLLRNDLGRIAERGSVEVPGLFETERHPTVWQLTSTVEATLRPDIGWAEILRATFPSGSVTGAPKVSTMHLIAEHETAPREVYCGAIGYLAPRLSTSEFSVAIRTGVISSGTFTYHAGGGITADSVASIEYEECLWKAGVVTRAREMPGLIETMSYHPSRGIPLLRRHLKRLSESATYWGIPCDLNRVQSALDRIDIEGPAVVRLTLGPEGSIDLDTRPMPLLDEPVSLTIAVDQKVDPADPRWFHKTADRSRYPTAEEGVEVVLVNRRGEITETNISNIMARFGDRWLTPTLDSGCLPGVYRSKVLEEGRATESMLTVEDLRSSDELAVTNAVRGWRKAVLSD